MIVRSHGRCARPAAGPRCARTFAGRPGAASREAEGAGRRAVRLVACGPMPEPAGTAGARPASATLPAAGALGRPRRSSPQGPGPARPRMDRYEEDAGVRVGRAVQVRPERHAASEQLRAAGRRALVGTRPLPPLRGPSPPAPRRPPAGGQAHTRPPPPTAGSTTSSGSPPTARPTWRSARTEGVASPVSASSAHERIAGSVPSTGTRCTASEPSRTACQSEQSSTRVATGESQASQAMLGPSAPSRPQQEPPRFSGISRVPLTSPGAMTTAPGVASDKAWTGAWIPRASASPGSISSHIRHGPPQGSGSTAKVPALMSTGSWTPFPYDWWV